MPGSLAWYNALLSAGQIGIPVSLGSSVGSSSATSSLTLTTAAAIPAGALSVVFIGSYTVGGGHTVSSVSDGTNTYTRAGSSFQFNVGGFDVTDLWYCANCLPVSASATLTVTMSTAVQFWTVGAACVAGVRPSSPLDVAPTGVSSAATTSPTISTGTLAQANEVIFGALFAASDGTYVITEASGFTRLSNATTTSGGNRTFDLGYKIANTTTTQAYSPTVSVTTATSIRVYSFKGN